MEESTRPERCNSSYNRERILGIISNFNNKRVLVIGDSILDANTFLEPAGFALELPIPKYKHLRTDFSFGGAANLVENLLELGAKVSFITLLGKDIYSEYFKKWAHSNLALFSIEEQGRNTIVKERFWLVQGGKNYPKDKINRQTDSLPLPESEEKIINFFLESIKSSEIIIFSDYRHGMLSESLIKKLREISKSKGKLLFASSQVSQSAANHLSYNGVDLVCLNLKEAESILKENSENKFAQLSKMLNSDICLTLGKKGAILYSQGKEYSADSIAVEEVDSCGAGDSFLASFSISEYKQNPEQALLIGNIWAGLSVTKLGTEVPKKQELINYIKDYN